MFVLVLFNLIKYVFKIRMNIYMDTAWLYSILNLKSKY